MKDTIYREDAIRAINKVLDRETLLYGLVRKITVDAIRSTPSADRPQGEWERIPYSFAGRYRCSICGQKSLENHFNFCPNCGCRMKGADDETN